MSEFDRDEVLALIATQTGIPEGYIDCASGDGGRVPVFADGRTTMCDTCGNSFMFAAGVQ